MLATLWRCPLCQHALIPHGTYLSCVNRHSFDLAKEGYVNLLPVQRKHSSDPGDNKAMLASRRYFLEQGYYAPLAAALVQVIETCVDTRQSLTIYDAGCGEGYYLNYVAQQLGSQPVYAGSDIAKTAMKMAAKQYNTLNFAVASSFALPLADNSVDILIRVFAPASESEIQRVLKPNGLYLWAYPAAQHLYELRQLIYDQAKPHSVEALTPLAGMQVLPEIKVQYALHLPDQASIAALLHMTPYYWSASAEKQAYCQQLNHLDLTVDFAISVQRKIVEPAAI